MIKMCTQRKQNYILYRSLAFVSKNHMPNESVNQNKKFNPLNNKVTILTITLLTLHSLYLYVL